MQCPNCQSTVPKTANVCGHCGHRLKQVAPPPAAPAPPASSPAKGIPGWAGGAIGAAAVLCIVAAIGIFGLFRAQSSPSEAPTAARPTSAPPASAPDTQPPPAPAEPLRPEVEPFDPASGEEYPSLGALADESGEVFIRPDQPARLVYGWCAKDEATLNANMEHLDYSFTLDESEIPLGSFELYTYETRGMVSEDLEADLFCARYDGVVRSWPVGEYTITYQVIANAAVDDGWDVYPEGEVGYRFYTIRVSESAPAVE